MLTILSHVILSSAFRNKKIVSLGWTGGLLSHYLAKDNSISESIARIPPGEEFAKLFVRGLLFPARIIQTQVWEPLGLVSVYPLISQIGNNIKNLLKLIHLGETTEI